MWLVLLLVMVVSGCRDAEQNEVESQTAASETVVVYDNHYVRVIESEEEAWQVIDEEAQLQSIEDADEKTKKIECAMEQDFGIRAVTLGEMEPEMAQKVYDACAYMFETYPVLYGKLTNFSIGNITSGAIAVSEYVEFVAPEDDIYPIVMKRQVVLNAREFLNEERLTNLVRKSVAEGHWMADMKIEAVVVHELGHILLGEVRMERYGLEQYCYITKENEEAYAAYNTDVLSVNQTTAKEIVEAAYDNYAYKQEFSLEEASAQISGYAVGKQEDGGISYEETIAEAVVDKYLHGENADAFSMEILKQIR